MSSKKAELALTPLTKFFSSLILKVYMCLFQNSENDSQQQAEGAPLETRGLERVLPAIRSSPGFGEESNSLPAAIVDFFE